MGEVGRPYKKLGLVRSRVDFPSILDGSTDEDTLCKNYYNKAVRDLVKHAKDKDGDAVVEVRSVVFMTNGKTELHKTPECSDDGEEGQILAQGMAVKWISEEEAKALKKEEEASAPKSPEKESKKDVEPEVSPEAHLYEPAQPGNPAQDPRASPIGR